MPEFKPLPKGQPPSPSPLLPKDLRTERTLKCSLVLAAKHRETDDVHPAPAQALPGTENPQLQTTRDLNARVLQKYFLILNRKVPFLPPIISSCCTHRELENARSASGFYNPSIIGDPGNRAEAECTCLSFAFCLCVPPEVCSQRDSPHCTPDAQTGVG